MKAERAISANRSCFQRTHFDSVAAFICAELLANGANTGLAQAFIQTEPVIAMALKRARTGSEVVLGLAGELVAIEALTRGGEGAPAARVVRSWAGADRSARDIQLGHVGIEVKTTTGVTSTHHVQGFHQVEFGHGVGGVAETHLFLFSLGVRWLQPEPGVGETIPELVETILARLPQPDGAWFLECLKRYGNDEATGYDHSAQNGSSAFARPFTLTFERLYDLRDPQVRIIRRSDVETQCSRRPVPFGSRWNFRQESPAT